MSPLDKMEKGIITGDWTLITEAYEALTSKKLNPPSESGEQSIEEATLQVVKEIFGPTACIVNGVPVEKSETADLDQLEQDVSNALGDDEIIEAEIGGEEEEAEIWDGKKNVRLSLDKQDKIGHYGNKTVLITDADTSQHTVATALKKKRKKQRRKNDKFKVKCCNCDNEFESRISANAKREQECNKCVKQKARELKGG